MQERKAASVKAHETTPRARESQGFVLGFHGVRYQVKDVSRSVAFYTHHLGFKLEHQQLPAFASVSIENLQILLSGPGASGSRALPDGRHQEPGGWNRIVLRVADLPARIDALKKAGLHFRNEMEVGPGGRQIQLEDPDGNPLALSCNEGYVRDGLTRPTVARTWAPAPYAWPA